MRRKRPLQNRAGTPELQARSALSGHSLVGPDAAVAARFAYMGHTAELLSVLRWRFSKQQLLRDICRCAEYNYLMYELWENMVKCAPAKAPFCTNIRMLGPWNRHFRANS